MKLAGNSMFFVDVYSLLKKNGQVKSIAERKYIYIFFFFLKGMIDFVVEVVEVTE